MSEEAGTPWTLHERFGPRSAGEAVQWVDSVARLGADHVKVRNWPASEAGLALVARAGEHGLPVVAHANRPFVLSGIATFEHGVWTPMDDAEARAQLWQKLASEGTGFVPTLAPWPIRLSPPDTVIAWIGRGAFPEIRYVPHAARAAWVDELRVIAREPAGIDWLQVRNDVLRDLEEVRRAGITLMAGTDLGAPLLIPGMSLHEELELLVRDGGLTLLQALQAATLLPARTLGMANAGVVATGGLADLVLLDANPVDDAGAVRRIRAVVHAGRLLDRAALDGMLAEAEAAAAAR